MSTSPSVTAFDCPKCGAPVSYGASKCEFCQSSLVTIDNGAAVLPVGLSAETLDTLCLRSEDELWANTTASIVGGAPYVVWQKVPFGDYSPAQWSGDFRQAPVGKSIDLFLERFVPISGEAVVSTFVIIDTTKPEVGVNEFALLTNYRLVVLRGEITMVVPWSQLVSWRCEPNPGAVADKWNMLERPVLRWVDAGGEHELTFASRALFATENVLSAIRQAADYTQLTPLQKQLLGASRWGLKKGVGLDLPPIARTQVAAPAPVQPPKCFPAGTSILTPAGDRPIEALRVGDEVLTVRPDGERVVARVRGTTRHTQGDVLEVVIDGKSGALRATGGHRVQTQRGWVAVRDLKVGEQLRWFDAQGQRDGAIRSVNAVGATSVYTLYVTGPQTFVADGVLCHNYAFALGLRTLLAQTFLDPLFAWSQVRTGAAAPQRLTFIAP